MIAWVAGHVHFHSAGRHGDVLVVPQFTLAASLRKGNRPSSEQAEDPERAKEQYESFVRRLAETGLTVRTG